MRPVTDPIRLVAHLDEYHGVEGLDDTDLTGDDLRRLHEQAHHAGSTYRPHHHADLEWE